MVLVITMHTPSQTNIITFITKIDVMSTLCCFATSASVTLAPAEGGTITGVEGSKVTLSFQTSCVGFSLSVESSQWLFSKMNLTPNDSSFEIVDDSNARYQFSSDMLSLTISDLSTADAGNYTLILTTSMTVLQGTIQLVVQSKCSCMLFHFIELL